MSGTFVDSCRIPETRFTSLSASDRFVAAILKISSRVLKLPGPSPYHNESGFESSFPFDTYGSGCTKDGEHQKHGINRSHDQ